MKRLIVAFWLSGLVLLMCLWMACSQGGNNTEQTGDGGVVENAEQKEPEGPKTVEGCSGTTLLVNPEDPSKRGPWTVGARTIEVEKFRVEVWYPAEPGSEKGKEKIRYDVRELLAESERKKISDEKNPWQDCACYRDLPPDMKRGPYPVVMFIHGTAGFRTQSLTHMIHWASRGFIVMSADHPGINLGDVLALNLKFGEQGNDMRKILKGLRALPGSVKFLGDRLDLNRIAISGHSAGGSALAMLGDEKGVQVLIPMAAGGTSPEKPVASTLVLGGDEDGVVAYDRQQDGYKSSPKSKRLVGIEKAGHLAFSDLCVLGKENGGLLKIAQDSGVTIPPAFGGMINTLAVDGCKEGQLDAEKGWEIVHFASSAVLEETLHCSKTAAAQLKKIQTRYPNIKEYKEELK